MCAMINTELPFSRQNAVDILADVISSRAYEDASYKVANRVT